MAKVEEMMVVRARTTLTGTILQRVYYSGEQCFSRNFNYDNVARLRVDEDANKKSLYFPATNVTRPLTNCILTEPKEGL